MYHLISYLIFWLLKVEPILSLLIAFISMLLTGVLTFLIIRQTSRLNIQQTELQSTINQQQIDMQKSISDQQNELFKRQIRIDLFKYRIELYSNLTKVFNYAQKIIIHINIAKTHPALINKTMNIINEYDTQLGDIHAIILSFRDADYLLSEKEGNILNNIQQLYKNFILLREEIEKVKVIAILSKESKSIANIDYDSIIQKCNYVIKDEESIIAVMTSYYLNISGLDR